MSKHKKIKRDEFDVYSNLTALKDDLANISRGITNKAGDVFLQSIDGVKDNSELAKQKMSKYVANKPFKSVGIAMLAGALVGYLVRK